MPEQDSADHWQSNQQPAADGSAPTELAEAIDSDSQSTSNEGVWEQDYQALLEELEQARTVLAAYTDRSPDPEVLEDRIRQLDQALEESLATIEQLNSQLTDQKLLESELAATEEVANIQQQALVNLKQQLATQQEVLENQISQAQIKDETVEELLTTIETLVETLQAEIERLRIQLAQNSIAIQNSQEKLEEQLAQRYEDLEIQQERVSELEAEILAARSMVKSLQTQLAEQQNHIDDLYSRLGDRGNSINQMERQLKQAHEALETQQELHETLIETQELVKEQNTTINALYRKIESLETHLNRQMKIQARLQEACQELTEQCNDYQTRTNELEIQTATLQEQILLQQMVQPQPPQESPPLAQYEADIQYWKDRYNEANIQTQKLREVIESLIPEPSEEVAELLKVIQLPEPSEATVGESLTSSPVVATDETDPEQKLNVKPRPIDLPTFLNNPFKKPRI